jgi:hypothetical protein
MNAERVYVALKQTLGYDGIIIDTPSCGNQTIYIVFDNSQIKNI